MKRNSNLELLRIIAILAIIAYHFEVQCIRKIIPTDTIQYCFAMFLGSFGRTGVNIFVLIGAWFLIDLPFRSMRVVRLYLATILYTVPITLIILFLGVKSDGVSGKELFAAFTPFTSGPLWFVSCYLFLLLVSPFLNILIHTLSPHMYRTLYWILLVVLVFMANRRGIPGHFFFQVRCFFHGRPLSDRRVLENNTTSIFCQPILGSSEYSCTDRGVRSFLCWILFFYRTIPCD